MSIVALAAGAFGLISVAGPAQALAASGTSASSQTTVSATGVSATVSTSVTLAPISPLDSSWD